MSDFSTLLPCELKYTLLIVGNRWNCCNEFTNGVLKVCNVADRKNVETDELLTLRVCPQEHRAVVLHAISPISMKLCQFKGSTPKLKKTNWFLFWFFFRGEIDHPPVFLGFHQGNRFKIGKMYEALTAMVFNQLLWGFAHILLHP